jgi:hypothetical protein
MELIKIRSSIQISFPCSVFYVDHFSLAKLSPLFLFNFSWCKASQVVYSKFYNLKVPFKTKQIIRKHQKESLASPIITISFHLNLINFLETVKISKYAKLS